MPAVGSRTLPTRIFGAVRRRRRDHRFVAGLRPQLAHDYRDAPSRRRLRTRLGLLQRCVDTATNASGSVAKRRRAMTTLYLATSGSHLTELLALHGDDDGVWVTDRSPQSSALMRDRWVEFVPDVGHGVRAIAESLQRLPSALSLQRRYRPTRAVSTGSSIAAAYLPWLSRLGVRCDYVESAIRVNSPIAYRPIPSSNAEYRPVQSVPHVGDRRLAVPRQHLRPVRHHVNRASGGPAATPGDGRDKSHLRIRASA